VDVVTIRWQTGALTHNNADVESYEWQPDGKRIIFSTVEPISAEEIKSVSEQGILYDSDASADFYGSIRAWQNRPIAYAALEAKPRRGKHGFTIFQPG